MQGHHLTGTHTHPTITQDRRWLVLKCRTHSIFWGPKEQEGVAIVGEAPQSPSSGTCSVAQLPTPVLQESSCGIATHLSQPHPPSVPMFLHPDCLAMPSLPLCLLPACPLPHVRLAHSLPQLQSRQQLLFPHRVLTPKSPSGLTFPGSEDQGQQRCLASRTRLPAPLRPSPTRLRTGRHRIRGEAWEEGGAGWEDTTH